MQVISATGTDSTRVYKNLTTEAQRVSTVVQVTMAVPSVPINIFTGTLQDILGFTNTQVQVLVDDGYVIQESVMYWKFTDIKEWCQLKSNIPEIRGGISYGDRKIKHLQSLAWWVMDFPLWDKFIDLNNLKLIFLLMPLRSPGLILRTQEIEKGSRVTPKSSLMKSGLNGKTSCTTTSCQG